MQESAYQEGFAEMGVPDKRTTCNVDEILTIIHSLGPCPQWTGPEYNKQIWARFISNIPKIKSVLDRISRTHTTEKEHREMLRQTVALEDFPSPESFARGLRKAKESLGWPKEGKVRIPPDWNFKQKNNIDDTQRETERQQEWHRIVMKEGETRERKEREKEEINSEMEWKATRAIRNRFHDYQWDMNKLKDGKNRRRWKPDLTCEQLGLTIEFDGYTYHNTRNIFDRDRKKARDMQYAGYYHLQFSGAELTMSNGIENMLEEIKCWIKKIEAEKGTNK